MSQRVPHLSQPQENPVLFTREPWPETSVWRGYLAYRITDGRLYAYIVPQLGRLISFGKVGGPELLWQMPTDEVARHPQPRSGWRNWGGDRTWLAPQGDWPALAGTAWPPDPAWEACDDCGLSVTRDSTGGLSVAGLVSSVSGTRVTRNYRFFRGDLIVSHRIEKLTGLPIVTSVWSVTCAPVPDEVWIVKNSKSVYPHGWHPWPGGEGIPHIAERDGMLCIKPACGKGYKIGVDSPHAAIAARMADHALVLRASKPEGEYPDGIDGAGFPVEFYTNGNTGDDATEAPMVELELLGPLIQLKPGDHCSLDVCWSVLESPTPDAIRACMTRPI